MMNLDLLESICGAATAGPWEESVETDDCGGHFATGPHHHKERNKDRKYYRDIENQIHADAKFIAVARQEMPELIANLKKLNKLAQELIERVKRAENPGMNIPVTGAPAGPGSGTQAESSWPMTQWPEVKTKKATPAPAAPAPVVEPLK